jgi:uncharacterized protein
MMTEAIATARHITLDALRGFAVMGILAMNIVAFAAPEAASLKPALEGSPTPADIGSWVASFVLFDGKMRGLFSLLFGASMLLIVERAEAKGENPGYVHFRRMAWLAVFGLAHFLFIWWGDILFLYAAIGCIAFLFRAQESRVLIMLAVVIYTIGFVLMALMTGSMWLVAFAAQAPNADPELVRSYADMLKEISGSAREFSVYSGRYADIVTYRGTVQWAQPFAGIATNFCETLPFMMIGMALFKNGFLTGEWNGARYRTWALAGIGLGGIGYVLFAALAIAHNFNILLIVNMVIAWSYPFRLMMILGYAAALILLVKATCNSAFMARVAATGRSAFSNYLGTSIIMTTIFYGYGFGLFGKVERPALWLFVIGAWLAMLLWSKPWLDRFHYGPMEWLWRSLARMQLQPMRRESRLS